MTQSVTSSSLSMPKIRPHGKVEESDANVDRIMEILRIVIDDKKITNEDGYFWDSCYPWVETNLETMDLLHEAYQHLGHDIS